DVRAGNVVDYGRDRLPAGPGVDSSDEVIVVEGRADVVNLLRHGIKNAIAMGGSRISTDIVHLARKKSLILFVDGDRGGELNARKLHQMAPVAFVAVAPDAKEVEELQQKEIIQSLRHKIPMSEYLHSIGVSSRESDRGMNNSRENNAREHSSREGNSRENGTRESGMRESGARESGMRENGMRENGARENNIQDYSMHDAPRRDSRAGDRGLRSRGSDDREMRPRESRRGEDRAMGSSSLRSRESFSNGNNFSDARGNTRGERFPNPRSRTPRPFENRAGPIHKQFGIVKPLHDDAPVMNRREEVLPTFEVPTLSAIESAAPVENATEYKKWLEKVKGKRTAIFLDKNLKQVSSVPVRELVEKLKDAKGVQTIVCDGIITKRLVDSAEKLGVALIVGVKRGKIEGSTVKTVVFN
ncbi:MAG: toprim domain-containing protein, partial [archaeon]